MLWVVEGKDRGLKDHKTVDIDTDMDIDTVDIDMDIRY